MPTIDPPQTQPPSNASFLRDMLDSTLAFHGLRPHVAEQLAVRLSTQVIAIELLPAKLRAVAEAIVKHGRAP